MKKILAIEDEQINQDLYKHILSVAFPNYEVYQAFDGEEGLKIVFEELPDTILLDIKLPDMDGTDICRILKSDDRSKDIPIVMISALGNDTEVRVRALNAGADSFLTKPFNRTEFIGLISVMLRIRHAEQILKQQNHELDQYIQFQSKSYPENGAFSKQISAYDQHFFWELDEHSKITFLSAGAESIIGYTIEDLVGQDISKVNLFPVKNSSEPFRDIEWQGLKKDNQEIWLAVSGFPIFDPSKRFKGFRGLSHNITDRKKMQLNLEKSLQDIEGYQDRVRSMNRDLTRVEERERKNISEHLHDGLGATLAIANMKLSTLFEQNLDPDVQRIIHEASELLMNAINDSKSIIYELSPPMLYELGLMPTLKWKLEQVENQSGLETKLESEDDFKGIDNEFLIFVYRIISELLLNTMKHAKAERVVVSLKMLQNTLLIEVQDNGEGMDTEILYSSEKKSSYGLYNMRERIETLGGSLRIKSEIGQFTSTIIRLPV